MDTTRVYACTGARTPLLVYDPLHTTSTHYTQELHIPITEQIAEEMIYDANLSKQDNCVSYDDLIATITIFLEDEVRLGVGGS